MAKRYQRNVTRDLESSSSDLSEGHVSSGSSKSQDESHEVSSTPWYTEPQPTPSPVKRMRQELEEHKHDQDKFLKNFFEDNYYKIDGYDYYNLHLTYLLIDNDVPGLSFNDCEKYTAEFITDNLRMLVEKLQDTIRELNIDVEVPKELKGQAKMLLHKERVLDVLHSYTEMLDNRDRQIVSLQNHVQHLNEEMNYLEAKMHGVDISIDEDEFMKDLQAREQVLESSMKEEMTKQRAEIQDLQQRLADSDRERVITEEKCMENIVEASEAFSNISEIIDGILEESGRSMSEDGNAQEAVKDFKNRMKEAMLANKEEISDLMKQVREQNQEVARLEVQVETNSRKVTQLQGKLKQVEGQVSSLQHQISGSEEDFKVLSRSHFPIFSKRHSFYNHESSNTSTTSSPESRRLLMQSFQLRMSSDEKPLRLSVAVNQQAHPSRSEEHLYYDIALQLLTPNQEMGDYQSSYSN